MLDFGFWMLVEDALRAGIDPHPTMEPATFKAKPLIMSGGFGGNKRLSSTWPLMMSGLTRDSHKGWKLNWLCWRKIVFCAPLWRSLGSRLFILSSLS
jgi:hypothetical protein